MRCITAVGLVCVWVLGCGSSGVGPGSSAACASSSPPHGCGNECNSAMTCSIGTYCSASGTCSADCSAMVSCGTDMTCNTIGQCIGASASLDGSVSSDTDAACASLTFEPARLAPNVVLLVDRSGSMSTNHFPTPDNTSDPTRWDALRSSLLGDTNLIATLQDTIRFGLALYTTGGRGSKPGEPTAACPGSGQVAITWVGPALNNYDAIRSVYSNTQPLSRNGYTPTAQALNGLLDWFEANPGPNSTIIVLATDGEPNGCSAPMGMTTENPTERAAVVSAAMRGHEAHINTYVISVGSEVAQTHLQDVANAGIGVDDGAEFWVATNATELGNALTSAIGRAPVSCDLELQGAIQDTTVACSGSVTLAGEQVPCDDPNGWVVVDATHIRLQGTACDTLKNDQDARLQASFPCGFIIPI